MSALCSPPQLVPGASGRDCAYTAWSGAIKVLGFCILLVQPQSLLQSFPTSLFPLPPHPAPNLPAEVNREEDHNAKCCRLPNSGIKRTFLLALSAVWSSEREAEETLLCPLNVCEGKGMLYTSVWQPTKLSIVDPLHIIVIPLLCIPAPVVASDWVARVGGYQPLALAVLFHA